MTAKTRTNTAPTPEPIQLGPIMPNLQVEIESGRPKLLDPMPAPSPERVAALLPTHRAAAEELARLRDAARAARAAYDRLDNVEAEAEDHRRAAFGEQPDAVETRPARVRVARLAAAEAAATHFAGLARWQRLMQDVEFGVELRARAAERRADVADALAVLADLRPVIELVDELHTVRRWLEPQSAAVRAITDEPSGDDGGELVAALDLVRAALGAAVADAPAGLPTDPAA